MKALDLQVGEKHFTGLIAGPEDAPLTVLLHGFPQTSHAWRWQVDHLSSLGSRVVAPDLRGHSPEGPRPSDVEDYRVQAVAQDVFDLVEALGHTTFHLAGHDLGGIIAWYLAASHPERVRTLTAVSAPHLTAFAAALHDPGTTRNPPIALFRQPAPEPERIMLADDAAPLRSSYASLSAEEADYYVQAFSKPGFLTAALNHFRAIDFDQWRGLPKVTVPTQFVWGVQDPYLAEATAEATAQHVAGDYRAVPLDGVAHWVPETAREQVAELIAEHVSGD